MSNIFDFAPMFGGIGDARAMSEQEMANRAILMAPLMQQASPLVESMLATLNYRRPVNVPPGWAEWSAHGNELI